MSEPKPTYEFSEGVLEGATLEQLQSLHEHMSSFDRREGEFTISDYVAANKIGYDRSKAYLQRAAKDGIVKARRVGRRTYYRFPK